MYAGNGGRARGPRVALGNDFRTRPESGVAGNLRTALETDERPRLCRRRAAPPERGKDHHAFAPAVRALCANHHGGRGNSCDWLGTVASWRQGLHRAPREKDMGASDGRWRWTVGQKKRAGKCKPLGSLCRLTCPRVPTCGRRRLVIRFESGQWLSYSRTGGCKRMRPRRVAGQFAHRDDRRNQLAGSAANNATLRQYPKLHMVCHSSRTRTRRAGWRRRVVIDRGRRLSRGRMRTGRMGGRLRGHLQFQQGVSGPRAKEIQAFLLGDLLPRPNAGSADTAEQHLVKHSYRRRAETCSSRCGRLIGSPAPPDSHDPGSDGLRDQHTTSAPSPGESSSSHCRSGGREAVK